MRLSRFLAPCLLLFACAAPAANADHGINGLGLAYLYGYGGFNQGGMQTYNSSIPYFAMHPPVYYGQRYSRPYGASPFAAWPQLQSNSAYAPQPHVSRAQTIVNPHACPPAAPIHGVVQTPAPITPLVIDNPFFNPTVQYTSADATEESRN